MWRDSRATSSWAACCSVAEAGRLLINGLSVTLWAQAWGRGEQGSVSSGDGLHLLHSARLLEVSHCP